MDFTAKYNPFSQWMNWKDVYVTFDSLEIFKKTPDGEPESLGHVGGGQMSWPLFMNILGGMMQYSAVETGFTEPLLQPQNLEKLADHLAAHDEASFVVKAEGLKAGFTALDQAAELGNQARNMWAAGAKMNPFVALNPFASQMVDAWKETGDQMAQHTKDHICDVFPSDELDLGEIARLSAGWLKTASAAQSPMKGFGVA